MQARRERWIIIYCTLQILARISVDVPDLSFKGNVAYFLNTRLQGLPPWSPNDQTFLEASYEQSHCWTAPELWAGDAYEKWASSKKSEKSIEIQDDRPLSPEFLGPLSPMSASSSFSFIDPKRHMPITELEANEVDRASNETPVTEISSSDQSYSSTRTVVTSRFAPITRVPKDQDYTKKPLPLRPGKGVNSELDRRHPRR